MSEPLKSKPWLPYVVPMGIYMAFLCVQSDANLLWMYPVKTLCVAAALVFFRKQYGELRSPMICGARALPTPGLPGEGKNNKAPRRGTRPTRAGNQRRQAERLPYNHGYWPYLWGWWRL